jgi:hypothetical protein
MPNTGQLNLFKAEVDSLPKSVPTRGVWKSLLHVLTDFKARMDDIQTTVRGDGNGERGLLHRMEIVENEMRNINSRVGVIQSDVRETLNMVRGQGGYAPKSMKEKLTTVGLDILKVTAAAILVWLLSDVFPRIFTIPPP